MDTSDTRARLLARIRASQSRPASAAPAERVQAEAYMAAHAAGPRPAARGSALERFKAMSIRMASTVAEVPRMADAPAEAARYLAAQGLGTRGVVWSALAALDWAGAGLALEARAPRFDEREGSDALGVTGAYCALAETGTLVLLSGPETPASTHLLPETHIAVVAASRILDGMEDAFALMRAEGRALPRAVNMVSGPSRTGDIEQTIVLGAHGPYRVHIIIALED
jgi:L-lactate dehydrogenase complex protein LldG